MVGHTFIYTTTVRKIKQIVDSTTPSMPPREPVITTHAMTSAAATANGQEGGDGRPLAGGHRTARVSGSGTG